MKLRGWRGIALLAAAVAVWHAPLFWWNAPLVVKRTTAERRKESAFVILDPPSSIEKGAEIQRDWSDPTIFALPSDRGFSAATRRRAPDARFVESEAPSTSRPRLYEPMLWSAKEGGEMAFAEAPPTFGSAILGEETSPPASEEGSAWRVYGEIAARNPSAPSSLPSMERDEPIAPTVVRAGVTPQGEARYVFVERGSGSDRVDDAALRFVQSLRFAALEGTNAAPLMWGFVKVLWRGEKPPRKSEAGR